jgi:hypothetical protein
VSTAVETITEIRPFQVEIPEEKIDDLRRRIAATRWPSKELVDDRSQGVQLATLKALADFWTSEYDFSRVEARLNAVPQFTTEIDGVEIHFIHVRSQHEDALPLVMTHGWPGSVIELLETIGPLTDPTAHGGSADEAFHLVLPSLPGYGFSGEPREIGWYTGRVAQAWAELMHRLGYTRYVAQGGDQGAAVTDDMGRQGPEGLVGIHMNLLRTALGSVAGLPAESEQERAALDADVQKDGLWLLPRAEHATADDRLRTAGFPSRPGGLGARPRHGQLLQDLEGVRRRAALRQPQPRQHPRQHHAVLADGYRGLRGAVVLGGRTGRSARRRASAACSRHTGRVHHLPRRDLPGTAQLGRACLLHADLLPRGRQGRPLRCLGGAGALRRRDPGGVQVPAVTRLTPIGAFATRSEAEIAQGLLASAGIAASVSADDAGGASPFVLSGRAQLLVEEGDDEAASEVLAASTDAS